MQNSLRFIWLILFLIAGIFVCMIETQKGDYAGLEDVYYNFAYLVCFLLAMPLMISWAVLYLKDKKMAHLIPALLPVLLLVLLVAVNIFHSLRKNVPVLLKAGEEGLSIELRADDTYRLVSFGEFSTDSYYGNYKIEIDTLTLSENTSGYDFSKFLIRNDSSGTVYKSGYLLQVYGPGNEREHRAKLAIYFDKRNKY